MRRYLLQFLALLMMVGLASDVAFARGGGFSSGGRGGFSGGSRSSFRSTPSAPKASAPKAAPALPPKAAVPNTPPSSVPPKAAVAGAATAGAVVGSNTHTGDNASKAAVRQQSMHKRVNSRPKSSIVTPKGTNVKVAGTPSADRVRTSLDPDRWSTRQARSSTYYSSIPASQQPTIIHQYGGSSFGDPFNGLFMYMLLSQTLSNQAAFHHNHWDEYSAERQQKLLAENASLKDELDKLKDKPRDPNYVPPNTDPDLVYSDEFVKAAYNPVEEKDTGLGFWGWSFLLLGLGSLGFGTWYIFIRRSESY